MAHLEVPVLGQQKVLRLEVAVGDGHLVEVLQGEYDTSTEERCHR